MSRLPRFAAPLALVALLAAALVPGCAAVNQMTALGLVGFDFAGVSDVRFVGIPLGPGADYSKLGVADVARVAAAALSKQAPIELVAHVTATNPSANSATVHMTGLDWKFFVEDHQALAGRLADAIELRPGKPADVPLAVRFDLVQLGVGGARDLYDLAVAIAGQGQVTKDLRLELVPTVDTPAGPMAFPAPIVVRRLGSAK
jgi:hypothetical protein